MLIFFYEIVVCFIHFRSGMIFPFVHACEVNELQAGPTETELACEWLPHGARLQGCDEKKCASHVDFPRHPLLKLYPLVS